VTFDYYKDAIARSTATALDKYIKAAAEDSPLDEKIIAIKGRPWHRWIQKEDGETPEDTVKWGHGRICLAFEKARAFWMNCLSESYTDANGAVKFTGVAEDLNTDARVEYHLSLPTTMVWAGIVKSTGDKEEDNKARCEKFMHMLNLMSKGTLNQTGCEAAATGETTGLNGKTKWANMTVKVSVEWDRAAQELDCKLGLGMLGDIELKRWNPRAHGRGREEKSCSGDGNDMETGNPPELVAAAESPDMANKKLTFMIELAQHQQGSLLRSVGEKAVKKTEEKILQMERNLLNMSVAALAPTTTETQKTLVREVAMYAQEAKVKANVMVKAEKKKNNKTKESPNEKPPTVKRYNSMAAEERNESDKGRRGGTGQPQTKTPSSRSGPNEGRP
jgi:hypothetical protein